MVSEKIYARKRKKRIFCIVGPCVVFDFDDNGELSLPVGARLSCVDFFRLKIVRIMFL